MPKKTYVTVPPNEIDEACAKEIIDFRTKKHKATPLKGQPKAIASITSREIGELRILAKYAPLSEESLAKLNTLAKIVGVLAQAQDKLHPEDNTIDPEKLTDEELEKLAK